MIHAIAMIILVYGCDFPKADSAGRAHSAAPSSDTTPSESDDGYPTAPVPPTIECPSLEPECATKVPCSGSTFDARAAAQCCSIDGSLELEGASIYEETLAGLECLQSISGDFYIGDVWINHVGLERLAYVGGDFRIKWSEIESASFPRLEWVGDLFLVTGTLLQDLRGFEAVRYVGGLVSVGDPSLTTLEGIEGALAGLDSGGVVLSYVSDGCDTSALQMLPARIETFTIGGGGSEVVTEKLPIEELGSFGLQWSSVRDVRFMEGVREITEGIAVIGCPELRSLDGLGGAVGDLQTLYVASNTRLPDLRGLEGVRSVAEDATVQWHSTLESLSGLDGLERVGGTLEIDGNPMLADANMPSLVEVGEDFYWWGPDRLVDFHGLEGLEVVGDRILLQSDALSLTGLDNLRDAHDVVVQFSDNLVDLTGLGALTSINGLAVGECDGLWSTRGVSALEDVRWLYVVGNPSLREIDLPSLRAANELHIEDNPSLPVCEIDQLVEQLAAAGSFPSLRIANNGTDDPKACE